RMAIQGLEVQRAALLAMQAAIDPGKQQATPGGAQPNPLLWPWAAMQQAMMAKVPAPPQAAPGGDKKKDAP
ncbi:MAG: hypothetical protein ACREUO_05555, partial [Burkholderiales bacterium]